MVEKMAGWLVMDWDYEWDYLKEEKKGDGMLFLSDGWMVMCLNLLLILWENMNLEWRYLCLVYDLVSLLDVRMDGWMGC